jgi:hypothetical protein
MKFILAIVIQLLMGFALMWGIIQAVHGSFWLLIVASLAYLAVFTRVGCVSH